MSVSTQSPPAAVPPLAASSSLSLYRMSLGQYHEMARTGILTEDDRVELLEGLIFVKMTKNPPHIVATLALNRFLGRVVPDGWSVGSETPITIAAADPASEPEPDFTVMRGDPANYAGRRPVPEDVALVIEIADTSLPDDQTTKKRIYAGASIPVYWIVNIPDRRIEVYSDPIGPAPLPDYRTRRDYRSADEVPLVIEGREVGRLVAHDVLPG
jgi:Uma2 family endonuclease